MDSRLGALDAGCGASTRKGCRVALVAGTALALALAGSWAVGQHGLQIAPGQAHVLDAMIAAALLAYVLAMALPFVPGIEIGLALMMLLGEDGIVLVYLATQLALVLSYLMGKWVPTRYVGAAFRWLRMEHAARLLETIEAVPPAGRAAYLSTRAPARWLAALGRHPGLALATVLNLPGNAVIGGVGGIGMIAGMCRAYPLAHYLVLVAAATTPVPLFLLRRGAA